MQWSQRGIQTNNDNKHKWLFFSITRHSLYWESPQFSLFVSYYGPLTWPHLPKTHFPISTRKKLIHLCHIIMYKKIVWNRQLLYCCNYLVVSIRVTNSFKCLNKDFNVHKIKMFTSFYQSSGNFANLTKYIVLLYENIT